MAFGKLDNWAKMQKKDSRDTLRYMDVHGDQQIDRGRLQEKRSMTGWNIFNGVMTVIAFMSAWALISLWDMAWTGSGELEMSQDPSKMWAVVGEHYVNKNDLSDKITVEEYKEMVKVFARQDRLPEVYDPGAPPVKENPSEKYIFDISRNPTPYVDRNDNTKAISKADYENLVANQDAVYEKKLRQYEQDLAAYRAYRASVDNPADTYQLQVSHYRNIINPEQYMLKEDYDKAVAEYEKKFRRGKLSDDVASIPAPPMDPAKFYVPYEYGYVPIPAAPAGDGQDAPVDQWGSSQEGTSDQPGGEQFVDVPDNPHEAYMLDTASDRDRPWKNKYTGDRLTQAEYDSICAEYDAAHGVDYSGRGPDPMTLYEYDVTGDSAKPWKHKDTGERITNDEMTDMIAAWEAGSSSGQRNSDYDSVPIIDVEERFSDAPAGMQEGPVSYKNKYDASVIPYNEYDKMKAKFDADVVTFNDAYMKHRQQYHPDNVDGRKKVFTMAPTGKKFLISFLISMIACSIIYAITAKQLKAQNALSDTADINQYMHDQHIALPEEVQTNYDWFPDVGAHSAVQVSSMISHMALSNKGLKKVELARRADKDIRDSDGDIEYYKGEILMDSEGKPLTDTVPMIDEQFMEDLFDASGALKDPRVRKRYDASKIKYNPDGSNRDKLGKFPTVAHLINDDWEFPIYEPQRPGGAYIVDTAPVNTMVKYMFGVINA